jgi:hypothetical protein
MADITRFNQLFFTTPDTPNVSAGLFDSYMPEPYGTLILRGISAGAGILINVVPVDPDYIDSGSMLVISAGTPPPPPPPPGPGPITNAISLGAGNSIIGGIVSDVLELKGLVAGAGVTITTNSTDVIFSSSSPSSFINGGGSGATALSIMQVLTATPVSGGSGYLIGDMIFVIGGTYTSFATFIVTAVIGSTVTAVSIVVSGAYTVTPANPVLTSTSGGGSGATFNLTYTISSVSVTAGGTGYTNPPGVVFTGGGGTGAIGTAAVSSGSVTSVSLTAGGSGYTSAPTISFFTGISLVYSSSPTTITFNTLAAGPGIAITSANGVITFTASPQATNTGAGIGIYEGAVGGVQQFKSLIAGNGIALTDNGTSITIGTGAGPNAFQNIGPGAGVFAQEISGTVQFKSLVAGSSLISITPLPDRIIIDAPGSNANGINLDPISQGNIFAGLQAGTFNLLFRGINPGTGISVTDAGNDIIIGALPQGNNTGTGVGIFEGQISGVSQFKSLIAGSGVTIVDNGTSITISDNSLTSVGNIGPGAGVFAQQIAGAVQLRTLVAGPSGNIVITSLADRIIIDTTSIPPPPPPAPSYVANRTTTGSNLILSTASGYFQSVNATANINVVLPVLTSNNNLAFVIKNITASANTIMVTYSADVTGQFPITLTLNQVARVFWDGVAWQVW